MKKLLLLAFAFSFYGFGQHLKLKEEIQFQSSIIKPIKVVKKSANHYFIDFGKAYFGTVILKSKSAQTDTIVVRLGEKLASINTIDPNPGGTIRYQQVVLKGLKKNALTTVPLKADKRNTKPQAIHLPDAMGIVMPFRYCELKNLKIPIEDLEIYQKGYHYTFNEEASYFYSSDTLLNRVYNLCKHTIKATSFTGYYIDGDRERIPYEADAFINQLSHYAVDNVYSIARRTNAYFIDTATWPTEWLLHTALLFYYDYLYTGDLSAIQKYYPNLKVKTLMDLEGKDGFISAKRGALHPELMLALGYDSRHRSITDIVDWPNSERDNYEFKEVNTVVNAFYYENLKIMSILAKKLGKNKDSKMFALKAERLKKVFQQKLINPSTGLFIDGIASNHSSLHANMFPLAFDLVPKKNIPRIIEFLKSKGMACSVYGAQYLLEALYKYGASDAALKLMTSTNDRSWWHMIKLGATMTLEAWDSKYKPNLDWNHAWGTAPANIIVRYLWGITPSKPGFEAVHIKPQLSNLTYSKIKVPTVKGAIFAEYKHLENGNHVFIIEIPKGIKGSFNIPEYKYKHVFLNHKKVNPNNNLLKITSGTNYIELKD